MRPSGIEPEAIAWEAMILPLNQERADFNGAVCNCIRKFTKIPCRERSPNIFHEYSPRDFAVDMMGGTDSFFLFFPSLE
jgi:hypothetical protein